MALSLFFTCIYVVDTSDDAPRDKTYISYVDDEHDDNHDYGDNTDDDRDITMMSMVITMVIRSFTL